MIVNETTNREHLLQAVHNNAVWCDTVCRSHGYPGEFRQGIWINRHETPRFYPNAVTLSPDVAAFVQLEAVQELVDAGLPASWAIKDSFCALDLTSLGFRVLFEAEWVFKSALASRPDTGLTGVAWVRVTGEPELAGWEMAWGGEAVDGTASSQARIFLPGLAAGETIAIIAAYQDERIVAGAIGNRTGDAVGVSNVFVPASEGGRFRAGCIAAVMAAFPGMPLVGYEAGSDLAEAPAMGFEALGPLRIWVKQSSMRRS